MKSRIKRGTVAGSLKLNSHTVFSVKAAQEQNWSSNKEPSLFNIAMRVGACRRHEELKKSTTNCLEWGMFYFTQ